MKYSKYNLIVPDDSGAQIILFNTLTGNCLSIDREMEISISAGDPTILESDRLKMLVNLGFIVGKQLDEEKIVKYFRDKEKYASEVVSSTVLLSWACNLKCIYCFEGNHHKSIHMSRERADQYIKFMKGIALEKQAKRMNICLFGGEPLINFAVGEYILNELKEFCESKNIIFSCSVITNGTLLTAEIIQKLADLNCVMIQVTLDGIQPVHDTRRMYKNGKGSFSNIIASLHLLNQQANKVHPVIRINVDKTNLNNTYLLLDYLGKDGTNLTNCTVDFGIVRGSTDSCAAYSGHCFVEGEIGPILADLWDAAERVGFKYNIRPLRRWLYCGLYSDNQFTITPECDVYKCWEHTGQKEHQIGILNENGELSNIQYAFYDWMSTDPLRNADCRDCVYLPNCGGGCGVISYNETETYHARGCFKVKGVVEEQVKRYVRQIAISK